MVPGIKSDAVRVDRAPWLIHHGVSAASITLRGNGLPAVPFKCAVTPKVISGHVDCVGSVTIGTETLDFLGSVRKTTNVLLSALPTVATANLDCDLWIEAISVGGIPILKETLTDIKIGIKQTQKMIAIGPDKFIMATAAIKTQDTDSVTGSIIRYDGIDYTVRQVDPKTKPSGREYMRKLLVTQ